MNAILNGLLVFNLIAGAVISARPVGTAAAQATAEPITTLEVRTTRYRLDGTGLWAPDLGRDDRPGAPDLPVWTTTVALPPTGAPLTDYESAEPLMLHAPAALPAIPVPHAAPLTPEGPPEPPTLIQQPDPAIYSQDAFYPAEPVQLGAIQWQQGRRLLALRVFPFQYNPATGAVRYHPRLRITVRIEAVDPEAASGSAPNVTPQKSTRAADAPGAARILTRARGLHRLTYAELAAAGVPLASLDPTTLALTHAGARVDIEVRGGEDGRFDPGDLVVFYAEPYTGRYMTQNVYQLWYGSSALGSRMTTRSVQPLGDEPIVTTITQTVRSEVDRSYYSTYHLPRTADHWFDTPLYANAAAPTASVTYGLPLDDALDAGEVTIQAAVHGGAEQAPNPDQSLALSLNGHAAGLFQWEGSVPYLATATAPAGWLLTASNALSLTTALSQLPALTGYWVSPDWVAVAYPARADAEGDQLDIEGVTPGPKVLAATGFTSADVAAYDVTAGRQPVRLTTLSVQPAGPGFSARLWEDEPGPHAYVLSTTAGLLAPQSVVADTLTAWGTPDHQADYLAIVHRSLWDAVQPLLDHRAQEGLRIAKVDVQDLYDEFSGGLVDPEALRAFLAYAYRHWNAGETPPRYVLLVGDGHYDFKGAARPDLPNLIPPYLLDIDPWIGETAADNRFVSVDGPDDYLPDMAIGRIPAKTPAQLTTVVQKIIAYETTATQGDWQRRAIFVADDYNNPAGNFHAFSDAVRLNELPAGYTGIPIYYRQDASRDTGAEMNALIKTGFNEGALLLQWYGHASRQRWGSVSMFDVLDPTRLTATDALPFTAHYACWSGYFIGVQASPTYGNTEQALGEALLLTAGRGAIADLSPSGLHVGDALLLLNRGVVKALLAERIQRVGDAVDRAKTNYFGDANMWHDLLDTMILLGDPATKLRLPPPRVYLPWAAVTGQ